MTREVFDQMGDKNLVSSNFLIDGYARNDDVEFPMKLFDEMPNKDEFN